MTIRLVLLREDLKVNLGLDTAFDLAPEEADGLMFTGVLFFCRHHSEMITESGVSVFAYHPLPMFDADNLVKAITIARERRDKVQQDSPETTKVFDPTIWKGVFGGESQES
jgi:hypothetical protein